MKRGIRLMALASRSPERAVLVAVTPQWSTAERQWLSQQEPSAS